MAHVVRPLGYVRYGDDSITLLPSAAAAQESRARCHEFLGSSLGLRVNPKGDAVVPTRRGVWFLGVEIFPRGRRLSARAVARATGRLSAANAASYVALAAAHGDARLREEIDWRLAGSIG
ncbi:MAG TPA: hypothetical protein VJJ47_02690 [Candidatus Paceibacterota bacterium]